MSKLVPCATTALVLAAIYPFSDVVATEAVRGDALLYGAVMDSTCEENTYHQESAALAAWAAKLAVNTVVGFASTFLEHATAESTVTRAARAPGMLYRWDSNRKTWSSNGCVRFWYGRQQGDELSAEALSTYGSGPAGAESQWDGITGRWKQLGLLEQPYLYGEVRLVFNEEDNAVVLQPVVLFARKLPEAQGMFRKSTELLVALDLRGLSGDFAFATHTVLLPDVEQGPVLVRGAAGTRGLASAWAVAPAPPRDEPKPGSPLAVPVTALVTFTSTSDGTLFGKTLASTFKAQKDALAEAITPATKAQKAEEKAKEAVAQEKAVTDAFDAEVDVLAAQEALNAATDEAAKPKLVLALRTAQYLADVRRRAAGFDPKYKVSGP